MLNLEAKTNNEKIILEYLNKNISEQLANKINTGKKTLSQCWSYIVSEARKLAKNNCAYVDDATVFGWAVHFFEEDNIKASDIVEQAEVKPIETKKSNTKPHQKDKDGAQISLFDMLG